MYPEIAAQLERLLLPAPERPHDDLEVAAVAAVRGVGEPRPVARDGRRPVVEARVDDERLRRFPGLEEVELRSLVAALVDFEQDPAVRQQAAVDGLRQVGQLVEVAAVEREEKELARARQVRCDEQRGAVRGEPERPCLRQLEKLLERARQRSARARG